MAVYRRYVRDRASKLAILVVIALVTQLVFPAFVRPIAEEWRAEQRAIAERTPGYVPQRSIWVIIKDPSRRPRSSSRSGRSFSRRCVSASFASNASCSAPAT